MFTLRSFSRSLLIGLFTIVLAACGGGGGGGSSANRGSETPNTSNSDAKPSSVSDALSGVFVDSPVQGITYSTPRLEGQTDSNGTFFYMSGERVTFSIGSLVIGSTQGSPVITPKTLFVGANTNDPRIVRILRLLQTLDSDRNPDNGIQISEATAQAVSNLPKPLSDDDFFTDPAVANWLLDTMGTNEWIAADVALEHFEETLNTLEARNFTLGGAATGIDSPITVRLNNGETLTLTDNGPFQFTTQFAEGSSYQVSVSTGTGTQCTLTNGSGTFATSNIDNIAVSCQAGVGEFGLDFSVANLQGELQLLLNSVTPISLTDSATFDAGLSSGANYSVTINQQPAGQRCVLSNQQGTVANSNPNITLTCVDEVNTAPVGGIVQGLDGQLTLSNNDDIRVITENGAFTFPTALAAGELVRVAVDSKPTHQRCEVANGEQTHLGIEIDNIVVTCEDIYVNLSGAITGLQGSGDLILTVNDEVAETLRVTTNGSFTFQTPLQFQDRYQVTIGATAQGVQCQLDSGDNGTIVSESPAPVAVSCLYEPPATYSVGGNVAGLDGEITLTLGEESLVVTANGDFTFNTELLNGTSYFVSLALSEDTAARQTCDLSNQAGAINNANVTNVTVQCQDIIIVPDTYSVGGQVSGLPQNGLVGLSLNGGNAQVVSNGEFTLATQLISGADYAVTVTSTPTGYTCSIADGSGIIADSAITNVSVTCQTIGYTLSAQLENVFGNLVLNNTVTGETLNVTTSSDEAIARAFTQTQAIGESYNITVTSSPENQTCSITNGSGVFEAADVSAPTVRCEDNAIYTISGSITGLSGALTVNLNGEAAFTTSSDDITASIPFTLSQSLARKDAYAMTVIAPATRTCLVDTGSGSNGGVIGTSHVTGVTITCTADGSASFHVGGNITNLADSLSVKLTDNTNSTSFDETFIGTGNIPFRFAQPLPEDASYTVTLNPQSDDSSRTCSIANGSTGIASAGSINVVTIDCVTKTYPVTASGTGFTGTLSLSLNGQTIDQTTQSITDTANFNFGEIEHGTNLTASVSTQPEAFTCSVSAPSNPHQASQNLTVTCDPNSYNLQVNAAALTEAFSVSLTANNTTQTISGNAVLTGLLNHGETYTVSVLNNGIYGSQQCGFGTTTTSSVEFTATADQTLSLTCATRTFTISGLVNDLDSEESVTLELTQTTESGTSTVGTYALTSSSNTFSGQVTYNSSYAINIIEQATTRTCLFNLENQQQGDNVQNDITDIQLTCQPDVFNVQLNITAFNTADEAIEFTSLLTDDETLSLSVNGNAVDISQASTEILNQNSLAENIPLVFTSELHQAVCTFTASGSASYSLTKPANYKSDDTTSTIYSISVEAECREKPGFDLSVNLVGIDTAIAPDATVAITRNGEAWGNLTPNSRNLSERIASDTLISLALTESINGYDCDFTHLNGEALATVKDSVDPFTLTQTSAFTVTCEPNAYPLNMLISGTDRELEVSLKIGDTVESFIRTPFGDGTTALVPLRNVAVGSALSEFEFTRLPVGAHQCVLQDIEGLVENEVLNGVLPLNGVNLGVECISVNTVARLLVDLSIIPDAAFRACIAATLDPNTLWSEVTRLDCNYSGSGDKIADLTGIGIFSNLREIHFDDQGITDITPLLTLNELQQAYLTDNPIANPELLEELVKLETAVTNSGSGTVQGANATVAYSARGQVLDTKVYVFPRTFGSNEVLVPVYFRDSDYCSEVRAQEFPSEGYSWTTRQLEDPCPQGVKDIRVGYLNNGGSGSERKRLYYHFSTQDSQGNTVDESFHESRFDVRVSTIRLDSIRDELDEITFADTRLNSCIKEKYESNPDERIEYITSLDLSDCGFNGTDVIDISDLHQLANLQSLVVGNFELANKSAFNDHYFLSEFTEPAQSLSDESWKASIVDQNLLACIESHIAQNVEEWLNVQHVTRLSCSNVSSLAGLEKFSQLYELNLSNSPDLTDPTEFTEALEPLKALPLLRILSGVSSEVKDGLVKIYDEAASFVFTGNLDSGNATYWNYDVDLLIKPADELDYLSFDINQSSRSATLTIYEGQSAEVHVQGLLDADNSSSERSLSISGNSSVIENGTWFNGESCGNYIPGIGNRCEVSGDYNLDSTYLSTGSYNYTFTASASVDDVGQDSESTSITLTLNIVTTSVSDLSNGVSLDFYNCLVSNYGETSPYHNQTALDLSVCSLSESSELSLAGISFLQSLETITFGNFPLESIGELDALPNLQPIDRSTITFRLNSATLSEFITDNVLTECILNNAASQSVGFNTELTSLECAGYGITDLDGLEYFTALSNIDLSNNLLQDAGVESILLLPNINSLDLRYNSLSFARIEYVRNQLSSTTFLPSVNIPEEPLFEADLTPNGLIITWDMDLNVDRYDVSYKLGSDAYFTTLGNVSSPLTIEIQGNDWNYDITLRASNDAGSTTSNLFWRTPLVSSVNSTTVAVGETIRITGSFLEDINLQINDTNVPYTIINDNELSIGAPDLSFGNYVVKLQNELGETAFGIEYADYYGASVADISAGGAHSCGLSTTGEVQCWGANNNGQLGDGSTLDRFTPVTVNGITNAIAISLGGSHSCALLETGEVQCWGANSSGQLGDATATQSTTPVMVNGITNASAISMGASHSCALLDTGEVQCWGYNGNGRLGDDTFTSRTTPVTVNGITNAIAISLGGSHSCALLGTGEVQCWGYNGNGRLGDGTFTSRTTPVTVNGITDAIAISLGGSHSCALLGTSGVQCWGYNGNGQLGDGTSANNRSTPVAVSGITNATAISLGGSHSCALLDSGEVQCWGYNGIGQVGDGSESNRTTPVTVNGITNATAISLGGSHSCALLDSDELQCWGGNNRGELGDGYSFNEGQPNQVTWFQQQVVDIYSAGNHSCALLDTGEVQCWGYSWSGQLGDGTSYTTRTTPVTVNGITNAIALSLGESHSCALLATGEVQCWGYNGNGRLGDGTITSRSTPVPVGGITNATAISLGGAHSCALLATGEAKCWGAGSGQLGDGTTVDRSSPVAVIDITNAIAISMGHSHSCALLATGEVQCWGSNFNGQLGSGITTPRSTPGAVNSITNAIAIGTGGSHSCALLATGEVQCWGYNERGQLGDGTTVNRSSPITVNGITNAVAISLGNEHSCALLATGDVQCWGRNGSGPLGDGTTTHRSSPITVGALQNVTQIVAGFSNTCAQLASGELYCWGSNGNRKLKPGASIGNSNVPINVKTTQ